MHVRAVVHVEQQRLAGQEWAVGGGAGYDCEKLAPCNLSVRVVEVSVFWGVAPAESSAYPEVLGPRRRVDRTVGQRRRGLGVGRTGRQRRRGLEVEAKAAGAGI